MFATLICTLADEVLRVKCPEADDDGILLEEYDVERLLVAPD